MATIPLRELDEKTRGLGSRQGGRAFAQQRTAAIYAPSRNTAIDRTAFSVSPLCVSRGNPPHRRHTPGRGNRSANCTIGTNTCRACPKGNRRWHWALAADRAGARFAARTGGVRRVRPALPRRAGVHRRNGRGADPGGAEVWRRRGAAMASSRGRSNRRTAWARGLRHCRGEDDCFHSWHGLLQPQQPTAAQRPVPAHCGLWMSRETLLSRYGPADV